MVTKKVNEIFNEISELIEKINSTSLKLGLHDDSTYEKEAFQLYLEKDTKNLILYKNKLEKKIRKLEKKLKNEEKE